MSPYAATCPDCTGLGAVSYVTYTSHAHDWDDGECRVIECERCGGAGEIELEEEAAQ